MWVISDKSTNIYRHRDLPGMQKACPCFDATKLQPLLAS